MTIETIHSDLLDEDFGIIVHGVNAQGVMNSGIAKSIRDKYPQVYDDYMRMYFGRQITDPELGSCLKPKYELKLGDCCITHISPSLKIVSGVTQQYYGRDPRYRYVDYNAIENIFKRVSDYAIQTHLPVKFPLIGCGLANGQWSVVEKCIESAMANIVSKTLYIKD